jgi:adenylosuccinate synthase
MAVMVLIGAQWGGEGKGKAADLYGERVQSALLDAGDPEPCMP